MLYKRKYRRQKQLSVTTIEFAGKASIPYSCMHTRLMARYDGKWPISLVDVSKPLLLQGKRELNEVAQAWLQATRGEWANKWPHPRKTSFQVSHELNSNLLL